MTIDNDRLNVSMKMTVVYKLLEREKNNTFLKYHLNS